MKPKLRHDDHVKSSFLDENFGGFFSHQEFPKQNRQRNVKLWIQLTQKWASNNWNAFLEFSRKDVESDSKLQDLNTLLLVFLSFSSLVRAERHRCALRARWNQLIRNMGNPPPCRVGFHVTYWGPARRYHSNSWGKNQWIPIMFHSI